MKVIVMVKATKESEAGIMPSQELLTQMGNFNEQLVQAGIMLAGEGLHPSSKGVRIRFSGPNRSVIDGPFAETKELVAGFWLWQVTSMEEAIQWVKRCPNPMEGESEIEIRPLFEMEDFGDAMTPELREQELRLRAESAGLQPPRIEQLGELQIGGINASYTFENRHSIPQQWNRLTPHLGKIPGQVGQVAYGVLWNYQPGRGFDYLAGVQVQDDAKLPADFGSLRLAPQRYAVFTHPHHVSELPKTMDAIWTQWMPYSPYKPAQAPSFERYGQAFDPQTGRGDIEVWVPIEG